MLAPTSVSAAGQVAGLIRDGVAAVMPHSLGVSFSNAPPDRVDALAHRVQIQTPVGPLSVAYGGGLYAVRFDGAFG